MTMAESNEPDENETTQKGQDGHYKADENKIKKNDQGSTEENWEKVIIQEDENRAFVEIKLSEKKALLELRCKLEDAIRGNYIYGKSNVNRREKERENRFNLNLWGVPLLPSIGHEGTEMILLKFLKSRDFKPSEAFEMIQKTLKWRKENSIDEILDDKLRCDVLEKMVYFDGVDKEGHPLCYIDYRAFKNKELYKKIFGTEKKPDEFVRWRIQLMEKGIKELRFKPGGVDSMLQITDLKNLPGPSVNELRLVSKKILVLLQENYPELVHRNIIINAPLWYYAFHMLMSRFMSQRTRSKFVFARPSRVTETLLKHIAPEHLPVHYGGLKREKDDDFSPADEAEMLIVKKGIMRRIKYPVDEEGVTVIWDMTTVGMEVTYKEEFIPDDEGSYKILLQEETKMVKNVRNSFYISEPGKIVITISNGTFKNKRVLYRFKAIPTVPMYIFLK